MLDGVILVYWVQTIKRERETHDAVVYLLLSLWLPSVVVVMVAVVIAFERI